MGTRRPSEGAWCVRPRAYRWRVHGVSPPSQVGGLVLVGGVWSWCLPLAAAAAVCCALGGTERRVMLTRGLVKVDYTFEIYVRKLTMPSISTFDIVVVPYL